MNKTTAKEIAETITSPQLQEMFDNAKNNITDWTETSSVNKGMTKGAVWNVLFKAFDVNKEFDTLVKKNMVWEFGDFLHKDLIPEKKKTKSSRIKIHHQDPIF